MILAFLVVVVLLVMRMSADPFHGPVVVPLDTGAELQPHPSEVHLLVGEGGERRLVGLRRERLGADGFEVAELCPRAELAGEPVGLTLIHFGPHESGPVGERRADTLDSFLDLQLVVLPVDHAHAELKAIDEVVVEVARSDVEPACAPPRIEIDRHLAVFLFVVVVVLFLFVVVIVLVFVVVVVFFLVGVIVFHSVMAVEFARERDAVAAVLHGDAGAREEVPAEVADARPSIRQFGGGVLDRSLGRLVVVGPPGAGARPEQDVALRVLHAAVGADLAVGAAAIGVELGARAGEQRVAVALVGRHDIDQTAYRVRAVEQRRRAPDDLDPLGDVRVDGHPVVAGLAREVTGPDAVLQNQDAVAVEAADDWTAGSRTEAPAGDARLVAQGVAQASLRRADDVERIQRRYRVECLERRFGAGDRGGHRHIFMDR